MNVFMGAVAVAVGIGVLVFRERLVQHIAEYQARLWRLPYSRRDFAAARVVMLLVGVGFFAFGVLTALGWLRLRS